MSETGGITAEMVKQLRDLTGAGMMDCKRALGETGGDLDKAAVSLPPREEPGRSAEAPGGRRPRAWSRPTSTARAGSASWSS